MQDMLDNLTEIARKAGEAILEVYQKEDFGVEQKSDDSPLTQADLAAHVKRSGNLAEEITDTLIMAILGFFQI